jgi:hypothetical protein
MFYRDINYYSKRTQLLPTDQVHQIMMVQAAWVRVAISMGNGAAKMLQINLKAKKKTMSWKLNKMVNFE